MERRSIGEEDKAIPAGGREPLELVEGEMSKVVIRGLGEYFGGEKKLLEGMSEKDFKPGRIKNVGLIVCDPDVGDGEVEMIVSRTADTIAGKTFATFFGERDENKLLWLKGVPNLDDDTLLNRVGWLGFKTVKVEGRNRGYERWFWTDEGIDTRYPLTASLVGAAQRKDTGEGDEGVEGDEIEVGD